MFDAYRIAVHLSVVDGLSSPLNLIARHLLTTEQAAGRLQERLKTIKNFAMGGVALLGASATLAAPLLFAIDKAAELQKQMIAIQLATRGTVGEMNSMRGAIEGVAAQTVFSNIDVAKMGKQVATGTGLSAYQVTSLLPVFGKFADVQSLMKGSSYQDSTNILIRAAHLAGHYDAPGLSKYADLLTKASLIVPGSLNEVANALQYSQGVAKNALGVDDENSVLAVALLNRLGLKGSRGGTNLIAAMTRTIPGIFGSGLLTGKSNEALRAMDMTDAQGHSRVFKDGKFDMFTWMGLMGEYVQREFAQHPEAIARQDIMKNFQHAFGVQGSRVATLLGNPAAIEQFRQIGDSFNQAGGVESMQKTFADQSVAQQWMNAKTNFISAMTELGMTLLPVASKYLKEFNGYMQQLISWMTAHPGEVGKYARDVALFAGAVAALGAVSIATSGILGLTTVIGGLARAARGGGPGGAASSTGSRIASVASKAFIATGLFSAINEVWDGKIGSVDLNSWSGLWGSLKPNLIGDKLLNQSAPASQKPVFNFTVQNKLDQRGLATSILQTAGAYLGMPQVGPSSFDGSLTQHPAGGAGF